MADTIRSRTGEQELTPERPQVTIYGATESSFLTMLIDGLFGLQEQGRVELRYEFDPRFAIAPALESFALWLRIQYPGEPAGTLAYFDLLDDPNIADSAALHKADVYFKRSFSTSVVSQLPSHLAVKLSAMPLHFGVSCKEQVAAARVKRAWQSCDWRGRLLPSLRRCAGAALRDAPFAGGLGIQQPPLPVEAFTADKAIKRAPKIYFRTRLYDVDAARSDEIADQLSQLNAQRITLIRALREAFGPSTFAGLYDSHGSGKFASDLLLPLPKSSKSHLSHLRYGEQFLIQVNSRGVAGSNGWKIAEILASGSALVTETLCYDLLDPLRHGKEMVEFLSPDACIAQCEKLLAEPERAAILGQAGAHYFKACLHPDLAVERILGVVLARAQRPPVGQAINS